MKDTGFDSRDAKPCNITPVEDGGWNAPNAYMFKKDGTHAYIYDPDGNLPENEGTSIMAIKNRQKVFIYSVEFDEGFVRDDGSSLSVCRILYSEPAAMKFYNRLKPVEVVSGDIRGILRGLPGCEIRI